MIAAAVVRQATVLYAGVLSDHFICILRYQQFFSRSQGGYNKYRSQRCQLLWSPIPYKGCSRGPKLGTYSDWGLSSVLVINKHLSHHGLRGRGVESRSLMTSVETRDLSGKVDRSRVNSNT